MKKLVYSILMFLCLFSMHAMSQSAPASNKAPCGMEYTDTGLRIKSGDFTICDTDRAFIGYSFLISDLYKDPLMGTIASIFVDDSVMKSTAFSTLMQRYSVSSGFLSILTGLAYVGWGLISIVLLIKFINLMKLIRKQSENKRQERQELVSLSFYFAFLMIMCAPLSNGMMLGQGLILIGALPSMGSSNALYSTYLSSTQTASTNVQMKTGSALLSSQSVANEMIEGELCQARTRLALLSENAKAGTNFFEDGFTGLIWKEDQDDVIERYSTCLSYSGVGEEGALDGSLKMYQLKKNTGTEFYCPRNSFFSDQVYYKPELYGFNHTCTQIRFDAGNSKFSAVIDSESSDGEDMDDLLESVQQQFKTQQYYPIFKSRTLPKIKAILENQQLDENTRIKQLNILFATMADDFIGPALDSSALLSKGTNEEKQVKFLAAETALLGATADKGAMDALFEKGFLDTTDFYFVNRYFGTTEERRYVFGVDYLLDDARQVAALMQRYQCALNWHENGSTRLFIVNFNKSSASDLGKLFGEKLGKMECVEFLAKKDRGSSDFDRFARYPVLDSRTNSDLVQENGTWIIKMAGNENQVASTRQAMVGTIAKSYFREMRTLQLNMAGYVMAVKLAVASRLNKQLNAEMTERNQDSELRSSGALSMSAVLLYLAQHDNPASHMGASIDGAIHVDGGGSNEQFVDYNAFDPNSSDVIKNGLSSQFSQIPVSELFSVGVAGVRDYPGPQGIPPEQEEQDSMSLFIGTLESLFMSPAEHIKNASGMPNDQSLKSGLQACYETGYQYCLSGTKHPLAAFSNMGNDLMSNMLDVMMVDAMVRVLNTTIFAKDDESGEISGPEGSAAKKPTGLWDKIKSSTKSVFSSVAKTVGPLVTGVFGKIFSALGSISMIAGAVFDVIRPFVLGLFVVGAVFAYVLPTMGFLFGLMLNLTVYSLIFAASVAWPLYAAYKIMTIEDSYKNGFKEFAIKFGSIYLMLPLIVVSTAVAFLLIPVAFYALNTLFALFWSGLTPDDTSTSSSGLLISLVVGILLYLLYFGSLFVLIKSCLGFMKSMTSEILQRIGFDSSDISRHVDSLGFESFVGANIMRTIGSLPKGALDKLVEIKRNGGLQAPETYEQQVKEMEKLAQQIEMAGGPERFAMFVEQAKNATKTSSAESQQQPQRQNSPWVDAPPQESPSLNADLSPKEPTSEPINDNSPGPRMMR